MARPGAPISVTYPTTPEGEPLGRGSSLNERGQFAAELPDGAAAIWDRGAVTRLAPAGVEAVAIGLSDRGQVAGIVTNTDRYASPFTWTRRRGWTPLPTEPLPPGWAVYAWSVNDRGQVSGFTLPGAPGAVQMVAWDRGRLIEPPRRLDPCLLVPVENCMNNRGQVIGTLRVEGESHAAVWQIGGDVVDLGTLGGRHSSAQAINDAGDVVGSSELPTGEVHAFLWRDGEMIDLGTLGGNSHGRDVNERGEVIGESNRAGEARRHAFVWRDGEMTQLDSLGGTGDSRPADINDRGQVVGGSSTPGDGVHAVLWQDGDVIDLGALLDEEESLALEINDRGQILGQTGTRPLEGPVVLWTAPARPGRS